MKYSVSIDEKKRTVTVTLADGTKGVARCCPSDQFNISTGIELALERAKVAKANAEKTKEIAPSSVDARVAVTMLIEQLEKVIPEGEMIVIGKGGEMTEAQKRWLRSIAGCDGSCECHDDNEEGGWYTEEEIEEIKSNAYEEGHDDGFDKGYDEAKSEGIDIEEERDDYRAALKNILSELEEVGIG